MERKKGKDKRMSTFCHQDQDARRKENHGYGYWSLPHTRPLNFSEKSLYAHLTLLVFSLGLPAHLSSEVTSFQSPIYEPTWRNPVRVAFLPFLPFWQNSITLWWVGMYCLHSPRPLQSHVRHWKCGEKMTNLQVWKCSRKWTTDKILEFERCENVPVFCISRSSSTTSYLLEVSTVFFKVPT